MELFLIVLVTSIWVLVDAKNIGVRKGLLSGLGDIGPWGWFFASLLLWIVAFPMYLYYRGQFKRAIAETNAVPPPPPPLAPPASHLGGRGALPVSDLEKLAELWRKGLLTDAEFEAKKKQLLGI